jgi:GAF domain-containing protein
MAVVSTERLADVFVEVADTLVDEFDVIEFLQLVTNRTAELIGASDVGLLLSDQRGLLRFMAASNEDVKRLELFQLQNQEGPCLDAYRSGLPVVNADLQEAGDRWPAFAPRATAAGFRSVHAIPLRLRNDLIGAMGVFGTDVGRLEEADVHMAQALAHVATIGLLQERAVRRAEVLAEQLQSALNSRVVVEQAKGAVSAYGNVSVDEAFVILRKHARRSRMLLGAVAHSVLKDPAGLAELADLLPSARPGARGSG